MQTSASRRPPLDRTSPIPLYFQIAENLKESIQAGAIAPGERLDNELGLAEQLGVSRATVRHAGQRLPPPGGAVRAPARAPRPPGRRYSAPSTRASGPAAADSAPWWCPRAFSGRWR